MVGVTLKMSNSLTFVSSWFDIFDIVLQIPWFSRWDFVGFGDNLRAESG